MKDIKALDTPVYSYWHALLLALFSKSLYIDVYKRWQGFGLVYLLLLVMVASIPVSMKTMLQFHQHFEDNINQVWSSLPPLVARNGHLVFDKPMPYQVKDKRGRLVAVIDTTGQVKSLESLYPSVVILVTRDTIYYSPPKFKLFAAVPDGLKREVHQWNLKELGDTQFSGTAWLEVTHLKRIKYLLMAIQYPAIVLFLFCMYAMVLFALAILAKIVAAVILKHRITYKETVRLFLVSSTGYLYFFFFTLLSGVLFESMGLVGMTLLAGYFSFAVLVIKRHERQLVNT